MVPKRAYGILLQALQDCKTHLVQELTFERDAERKERLRKMIAQTDDAIVRAEKEE